MKSNSYLGNGIECTILVEPYWFGGRRAKVTQRFTATDNYTVIKIISNRTAQFLLDWYWDDTTFTSSSLVKTKHLKLLFNQVGYSSRSHYKTRKKDVVRKFSNRIAEEVWFAIQAALTTEEPVVFFIPLEEL